MPYSRSGRLSVGVLLSGLSARVWHYATVRLERFSQCFFVDGCVDAFRDGDVAVAEELLRDVQSRLAGDPCPERPT